MDPSDELIPTRWTLLSRLKDAADADSWQEFYDTYWRLIYRAATKSGLTDAEAQEVVQEVVIGANELDVARDIPQVVHSQRDAGAYVSAGIFLARHVVEDEPEIRALACEMLEAQGYRTLAAGSGEEALGLAVRYPGAIDLLLADVVMTGLSGPALAGRFAVVRPQARVLFMSGYAGDDLARRGIGQEAQQVLTKPFGAETLCARVRESLDA